eukprot:gene2217-biopygen3073
MPSSSRRRSCGSSSHPAAAVESCCPPDCSGLRALPTVPAAWVGGPPRQGRRGDEREPEPREVAPEEGVLRARLQRVREGVEELLARGCAGGEQPRVEVVEQRRGVVGDGAVGDRRDAAAVRRSHGSAGVVRRPGAFTLVAGAREGVELGELAAGRRVHLGEVVHRADDALLVDSAARVGAHVAAQGSVPHALNRGPDALHRPAGPDEDAQLEAEVRDVAAERVDRDEDPLVEQLEALARGSMLAAHHAPYVGEGRALQRAVREQARRQCRARGAHAAGEVPREVRDHEVVVGVAEHGDVKLRVPREAVPVAHVLCRDRLVGGQHVQQVDELRDHVPLHRGVVLRVRGCEPCRGDDEDERHRPEYDEAVHDVAGDASAQQVLCDLRVADAPERVALVLAVARDREVPVDRVQVDVGVDSLGCARRDSRLVRALCGRQADVALRHPAAEAHLEHPEQHWVVVPAREVPAPVVLLCHPQAPRLRGPGLQVAEHPGGYLIHPGRGGVQPPQEAGGRLRVEFRPEAVARVVAEEAHRLVAELRVCAHAPRLLPHRLWERGARRGRAVAVLDDGDDRQPRGAQEPLRGATCRGDTLRLPLLVLLGPLAACGAFRLAGRRAEASKYVETPPGICDCVVRWDEGGGGVHRYVFSGQPVGPRREPLCDEVADVAVRALRGSGRVCAALPLLAQCRVGGPAQGSVKAGDGVVDRLVPRHVRGGQGPLQELFRILRVVVDAAPHHGLREPRRGALNVREDQRMVDRPAQAPRDVGDDFEALRHRVVQDVVDAPRAHPLRSGCRINLLLGDRGSGCLGRARAEPRGQLVAHRGDREVEDVEVVLERLVAIPAQLRAHDVEDGGVADVPVAQNHLRASMLAQGHHQRVHRARPPRVHRGGARLHRGADRVAPGELEVAQRPDSRGSLWGCEGDREHVVVLARRPCVGHRVVDEGADALLRAPAGDGPHHAPRAPAGPRVRLPRAAADEEEDAEPVRLRAVRELAQPRQAQRRVAADGAGDVDASHPRVPLRASRRGVRRRCRRRGDPPHERRLLDVVAVQRVVAQPRRADRALRAQRSPAGGVRAGPGDLAVGEEHRLMVRRHLQHSHRRRPPGGDRLELDVRRCVADVGHPVARLQLVGCGPLCSRRRDLEGRVVVPPPQRVGEGGAVDAEVALPLLHYRDDRVSA